MLPQSKFMRLQAAKRTQNATRNRNKELGISDQRLKTKPRPLTPKSAKGIIGKVASSVLKQHNCDAQS